LRRIGAASPPPPSRRRQTYPLQPYLPYPAPASPTAGASSGSAASAGSVERGAATLFPRGSPAPPAGPFSSWGGDVEISAQRLGVVFCPRHAVRVTKGKAPAGRRRRMRTLATRPKRFRRVPKKLPAFSIRTCSNSASGKKRPPSGGRVGRAKGHGMALVRPEKASANKDRGQDALAPSAFSVTLPAERGRGVPAASSCPAPETAAGRPALSA
jgi:hypothetical protein